MSLLRKIYLSGAGASLMLSVCEEYKKYKQINNQSLYWNYEFNPIHNFEKIILWFGPTSLIDHREYISNTWKEYRKA